MSDLILYGILIIAFFAFYVIKALVEVAMEKRKSKKYYRKDGQLVSADEVIIQDTDSVGMSVGADDVNAQTLPETATRTYNKNLNNDNLSFEKITCPTCGAPLPSMHHRCSYCGTKCRIKKNN